MFGRFLPPPLGVFQGLLKTRTAMFCSCRSREGYPCLGNDELRLDGG